MIQNSGAPGDHLGRVHPQLVGLAHALVRAALGLATAEPFQNRCGI